MWIENDVLNHFFQISWGSGWNSRSVDNTGYLFEIDLNSVNQVFFDKETKRVEFLALGKGNHYADIATGRIDKQWDLKQGYKCILYDYYEPSIVKSLSEKGIPIIDEQLNDFSIFTASLSRSVYIYTPHLRRRRSKLLVQMSISHSLSPSSVKSVTESI